MATTLPNGDDGLGDTMDVVVNDTLNGNLVSPNPVLISNCAKLIEAKKIVDCKKTIKDSFYNYTQTLHSLPDYFNTKDCEDDAKKMLVLEREFEAEI